MTPDGRLELVDRVTRTVSTEIDRLGPDEAVAWPTIPTVRAMVAHLGGVHRWVVEVLRTGGEAADVAAPDVGWDELRGWYDEGRMLLLGALASAPPDAPCWILGDRRGTAGFWRRRMVFESVKHLIDLRAAGGRAWEVAPELGPAAYADGVDELFEEFLRRSRTGLPSLPGSVSLRAIDTDRAWTIRTDWHVVDGIGEHSAASVTAPAGELALMMWERADPWDASRFEVRGDRGAVSTLRAAPIHPWRSAAR